MTRAVEGQIIFGPYRLDRANARLLRHGRPVALTPKAFDVLHYLASRPDRLVTKGELLSAVWPDVIVSDASIKVCVREVRKALDDEIKSPKYVETVHRRGYRFIASVNEGRKDAGPPAASPEPAAQTVSERVAEPTPRPTASCPAAPRHALVGRDGEMRRLEECFALALAGQRQCVFVTGGTGTGKTTLVEAFTERVSSPANPTQPAAAPVVMVGHCFEQFGTSEPYMPVWEAIGRLARERPSPLLTALLDRHAAVHAAAPGQPAAPVQARPTSPTPTAPIEPRAMSERLLREMVDAIESAAADAPLVLLLEDVHWVDFSTLDLISALARRRSPARLMVAATYRPAEVLAAEHPLRGVVQGLLTAGLCDEVPLDFLGESAVAQYLAARFPGADLPPSLARRLHRRTDGHPLFLVHLVDDLIERRLLVEQSGRWHVSGEPDETEETEAADLETGGVGRAGVLETQVPRTVRAMIELQLARLDADERHVLEAAAAAGVAFSAAAVAAALAGAGGAGGTGDVERAEQACDGLARRHRFLEPGDCDEWPDGTIATRYRFVHELYHNVVYEQVPVARRVRLHRALGVRLEAAWGERSAGEAAGLAMHFERGRDWLRAVHYLRQAARAAGRQYAHREAIHYLRRALAALDHLPPPDRAAHELDVLMGLAVNLQVTRGYAAPEVQDLHARAYALCRPQTPGGPGAEGGASDVSRAFPVLWSIWVFHKVRSDLRKADDLARQLLSMANEAGDPALLLQAHQAMSMTALCLGHPDAAHHHAEQVAALYDPARHAANTDVFGQDPGVATLAFGAVALCLLGRPQEAVAASEKAIALARRSTQPSTLALAMHFAAMLHQCRGDPLATERWAHASIDLSAGEGFSFWHAGGVVLRGWAWADRGARDGDPDLGEAGIAEIRRGLDAWLATGSRTYHTYFLGLLAAALTRLGRPAEARPVLDEAMAATQSLPEGLYEAELYRLKGRSLARVADPPPLEAREHLARALARAREQKAKWFEWRAAVDLAAVLRRQGREREADELLAASDIPAAIYPLMGSDPL